MRAPSTDSVPSLPDESWRYRYDFDGDHEPDSITYTYSGGAHCCYQLTVHLSERKTAAILPFYIEGGYIIFDLSQPENFSVTDEDKNSVYELNLNLAHYKANRSEAEIRQLQDKYGFHGTRVSVTLDSGNMKVSDIKQ